MDIFKACVVLLQNLCHVIAERQAFPVRDKTDPVADSGDPVQTHKVIGGKGVASMPGIGVSCACGMFAAVSGVDIPGIPKEVLGIRNGTAVIFCNGMSA